MKKNIKVIIVILSIVALSVGGWMLFNKNSDVHKGSDKSDASLIVDPGSTWNPYADKYSLTHTLSDFILSSNEGNYITKMTVTLDFTNEDSFARFLGLTESEKIEDYTRGEFDITPMEYTINNEIGKLMMEASEEVIINNDKLNTYLFNGINEKINLETDLLKGIFIENYIAQ